MSRFPLVAKREVGDVEFVLSVNQNEVAQRQRKGDAMMTWLDIWKATTANFEQVRRLFNSRNMNRLCAGIAFSDGKGHET